MPDQVTPETPPTIQPAPGNSDAPTVILERSPEANLPQKRVFRINAQNARSMALRSHEVRKAAKLKQADDLAAAQAAEDAPATGPAAKPDEYLAKRLKRVRAQLDKLDAMIAEETDPQKIDRLASAQARLAEQERNLAGRPLPGSLRPATERAQARGAGLIQSLPAPPKQGQQG